MARPSAFSRWFKILRQSPQVDQRHSDNLLYTLPGIMAKHEGMLEQVSAIIRQHGADNTALIDHYRQMSHEVNLKVQQLETEKSKMLLTWSNYHHEHHRLQATVQELQRQNERALLALSDVALHLAPAVRLRSGPDHDVGAQLRGRGLREDTIEMVLQSPGFMEELESYVAPRRLTRSSSKA
jgi:hypothetical protein